jgi:hypothetical protein
MITITATTTPTIADQIGLSLAFAKFALATQSDPVLQAILRRKVETLSKITSTAIRNRG